MIDWDGVNRRWWWWLLREVAAVLGMTVFLVGLFLRVTTGHWLGCGRMAMKCPLDWEIYRRPLNGFVGNRHNGHLVIPKRKMVIVFSSGGGWEHVSVSLPDRTPTWEEMEEIKRRFWAATDTVMQLHVPESDHKNYHPYCLHLWRSLDVEIPRPPSIMVAP